MILVYLHHSIPNFSPPTPPLRSSSSELPRRLPEVALRGSEISSTLEQLPLELHGSWLHPFLCMGLAFDGENSGGGGELGRGGRCASVDLSTISSVFVFMRSSIAACLITQLSLLRTGSMEGSGRCPHCIISPLNFKLLLNVIWANNKWGHAYWITSSASIKTP